MACSAVIENLIMFEVQWHISILVRSILTSTFKKKITLKQCKEGVSLDQLLGEEYVLYVNVFSYVTFEASLSAQMSHIFYLFKFRTPSANIFFLSFKQQGT